MGNYIGILLLCPEDWFCSQNNITKNADLANDEIEKLIIQRQKARENKDFTQADKIRLFLAKHDILIEDNNKETIWRRKNNEWEKK